MVDRSGGRGAPATEQAGNQTIEVRFMAGATSGREVWSQPGDPKYLRRPTPAGRYFRLEGHGLLN